MGSTPEGVQCPLTSSLGEFPGYWDWLWYPGLLPVLVSITFPFAFHISVFSIHSSSPAIGFHSSIFHGGGICTRHQPSSFTWTWDRHWVTVDPEAEWKGEELNKHIMLTIFIFTTLLEAFGHSFVEWLKVFK